MSESDYKRFNQDISQKQTEDEFSRFTEELPTSLASPETKKPEYTTLQQVKDFLRTGAQGSSLGFSDEAIAAVRAMAEGRPYEETVKEEREGLERFKEEYPLGAFATEVGGGVLGGGALAKVAKALGPASKIGGTLAGVGSTETPFLKSLVHGAGLGAVEGAGKAEEMQDVPSSALKGAAAGVATAGLVKGGTGVASWLANKLPSSLREGFKPAATAYDYLAETTKEAEEALAKGQKVKVDLSGRAVGKEIGGEESFGVLHQAADSIKSKLENARKLVDDRYQSFLLNADQSGALVPLEQKIIDVVTKRSRYLSGDDRRKLFGIIQDGVDNGYQLKPSQAADLKDYIKQIESEVLKSSSSKPGVAPDIRGASIRMGQILDTNLPDYKEISESARLLYEIPEVIMGKGAGKSQVRGLGKDALSSGGYLRNETAPQQFFGDIVNLIKNGSLERVNSDLQKSTIGQTAEAFAKLELLDKKMIAQGIIPENLGFFSKQGIGAGADEVMDKLIKDSDRMAARIYKIGKLSTENGSEAIDTFKNILLKASPQRAAIFAAEQAVTSPTLRALGTGVEYGMKAAKFAGSSIHKMPDFALGPVASRLVNFTPTKAYSEAYLKADREKNERGKNLAKFAIESNPVASKMYKEELARFTEELALANESIDFTKGDDQDREPASEIRPDSYKQKRNQFISQWESPPEGVTSNQFLAYDDKTSRRIDPYNKRGNSTIGYGFNLDAPGNLDLMKRTLRLDDQTAEMIYSGVRPINRKQAMALYEVALNKAERILDAKLQKYNITNLTDNQRAALTSLVYNSGGPLVGPRILNAIKEGDFERAAKSISVSSNAQAKKNPKAFGGLIARRALEAELFLASEENEQKALLGSEDSLFEQE